MRPQRCGGALEDTSPWRHTHHEGPTPIRATRHRGRRARLPHPTSALQKALPSSQESSTTPVDNGYRAHRTGRCRSCWCLHAGCEHQLVERSPQHRGKTHRAIRAHAVGVERACHVGRLGNRPRRSPRSPRRVRSRHIHQTQTTRRSQGKHRTRRRSRGRTLPRAACLRVEHRRHSTIHGYVLPIITVCIGYFPRH